MAVLKPRTFLDDLDSFTNNGGAVSGTPTAGVTNAIAPKLPTQPSIGDLIAKQQEQEAQIKRPYAHGLTPQSTESRGIFDTVDAAPVVPRQTPLEFVQSLTQMQHVTTDFINDTYKPEAQYIGSDKFKTTVISPTVSASFAQGKQLYTQAQKNISQYDPFMNTLITGNVTPTQTLVEKQTQAIKEMEANKNKFDGADTQLWVVTDGDELPHVDGNYMVVGRDRLSGVQDGSRAVMYDVNTGKIYHWDTDDIFSSDLKDKLTKASDKLEATNTANDLILQNRKTQIDTAKKNLDTMLSTTGINDTYNTAVTQYNNLVADTEQLTKKLYESTQKDYDEYTSASKAYSDYGVFGIDKDFNTQINEYVSGYDKIKHIERAMTTHDDPYQTNSLKDALVNTVNQVSSIISAPIDMFTNNESYTKAYNAYKEQGFFGNDQDERSGIATFASWANNYIKPVQLYLNKEITGKDLGSMLLNNVLTGSSEDLDLITCSGIVKSLLIHDNSDPDAGLQESWNNLQKYFGVYKDDKTGKYTGSHNFNWDTGAPVSDFFLEMASDPTIFATALEKGLTKGVLGRTGVVTNSAAEHLRSALDNLGVTVSDDIIDRAAKSVANSTMYSKSGLADMKDYFNAELYKIVPDVTKDNAKVIDAAGQAFADARVLKNAQYNAIAALHTFNQVENSAQNIATLGVGKVLEATLSGLTTVARKVAMPMMDTIKNGVGDLFEGDFVKLGTEPKEAYQAIQHTVNNALDVANVAVTSDVDHAILGKLYNDYAHRELSQVLRTIDLNDTDASISALDQLASAFSKEKYTKFYDGTADNYITNIADNLLTPELGDSGTRLLNVVQARTKELYSAHFAEQAVKKYGPAIKAFKELTQLDNGIRKINTEHPLDTNTMQALYLSADQRATVIADALKSNGVDPTPITNYMQNTKEFFSTYNADPVHGTTMPVYTPELASAYDVLKQNIDKMQAHLDNVKVSASAYVDNFAPTEELRWKTVDATGVIDTSKQVKDVSEILVDALNESDTAARYEKIQDCFQNYCATTVPTDKLYAFVQSDLDRVIDTTSNQNITEAINVLTDPQTTAYQYIENSTQKTPIKYMLDTLTANKTFVGGVMNSAIDSELKLGVLDTLGKSNATAIHNMVRRADMLDTNSVDKCVDEITDYIITKAERYQNQKANLALFNVPVSNEVKHFNTIDTEYNVKEIITAMESDTFKSAKESFDKTSDIHRNIFFSTTGTSDANGVIAITVGTEDGKIRTFIDGDAPYAVRDTYTRKTHGCSVGDAIASYNLFVAEHKADVYTHEQFVIELRNHLKQLSEETTSSDNRAHRYIGFNCSNAGTGQTRAFTKFASRNVLRTYIADVQDIANFVRADNGYAYFSDSATAQVRQLVRQYTDACTVNAFAGDVLPDLTTDKIATRALSVNTLVQHLNALDDGVDRTLFLSMQAEEKEQTLNALNQLLDGIQEITENTKTISDTFKNQFLNENAFVQMLSECDNHVGAHVNLMNMLYKDVEKGKGLSYNVQLAFNRTFVDQYFDFNKLTNSRVKLEDATLTYMKYAKQLDTMVNRIANPELVCSVHPTVYDEAQNYLLYELTEHGLISDSFKAEVASCLSAFKDDKDALTTYTFLRRIAKEIEANDKESRTLLEMYKEFSDARGIVSKDTQDTLALLTQDSDLVFGNRSSYTPGMSPLASRFAEPSSSIYEYKDLTEQLNIVADMCNSSESAFKMYENVLDKHGLATAQARVTSSNYMRLTAPLRSLITDISTIATNHYDTYMHELSYAATEYDRAVAKSKYDSGMRSIAKAFDDSKIMCNGIASSAVLTMPADKIEGHIIKNCNNFLCIDTSSALLASAESKLAVTKFVANAKFAGLSVDVTDNYIKVYKDLSEMDDEAVAEYLAKHKDFEYAIDLDSHVGALKSLSSVDNSTAPIRTRVLKMLESLQDYMPTQFFLSGYNAAGRDSYDALKAVPNLVPEHAKIDTRILQYNGAFNASFNCNFIGDYATTDRLVYTKMSNNFFSNILTGVNMAKDSLQYTQDMFNLFTNHVYTFKNVVNTAYRIGHDVKPDIDAVLKGIKDNDMVAYTCTPIIDSAGNTVRVDLRIVSINNNKDFMRVYNSSNVVLTDRSVYEELFELTKTKNSVLRKDRQGFAGKTMDYMYSFFKRNIRSPQIEGYLKLHAGTWFNNFVDSNVKAGLQTHFDKDYLHLRRSIDGIMEAYDDTAQRVQEELLTNHLTAKNIGEWYDKQTDVRLAKQDFLDIFAISQHSAGTVSPMLDAYVNDIATQLSKRYAKATNKTVDEVKDLVTQAVPYYSKAYSKFKGAELVNKVKLYTDVEDALRASGKFDESTIHELTSLSAYYKASDNSLSDIIHKVPVLKQYMNFNEKMFSKVETDVRTSVALYYKWYRGYSTAAAMKEVERTQFNYAMRSPLMDKIDVVFPFSTFKLYNTKFWMIDAMKDSSITKTLLRYMQSMDYTYDDEDISEFSRYAYYRAMIANASDEEIEDASEADPMLGALVNSVQNSIDNYRGTSYLSTKLNGKITLDETHMLKVGNSFMDYVDFVTSLLTIPTQMMHGDYTSFLENNVYSQFVTVFKLAQFQWQNAELKDKDLGAYNAKLEKFVNDNQYDLIDFIPVFGVLANDMIKRAGVANVTSLPMSIMFPDLGDLSIKDMYDKTMDTLSVAMPSMFGITKQNNYSAPVGYDWYSQSAEYKATHRYVIGVSYTPSWVTKDPTVYVNTYAALIKMGYDSKTAKEMIQDTWYVDKNGALRNYEKNSDLPSYMRYNHDAYDKTLEQMLLQGLSPDDAIEAIRDGIDWVDETGKHITPDEAEAVANSKFLDYYSSLPEYVQYEQGQYGKLFKYYMNVKHMSADDAKLAVKFGSGYINPNGTFTDLTSDETAAKEKQLNDAFTEYFEQLPDYMKYEPGAYSRTLAEVKKQYSMDTETAKQFILQNNAYVTVTGELKTYSATEVEQINKQQKDDFYSFYSMLPSTTKYEHGAYARTLAVLKNLGYTQDEAKQKMLDGFYVGIDGHIANVFGKSYTKAYKYSNTYHKYYKSNYYARKQYVRRPKRVYNKYPANIHQTYTTAPYLNHRTRVRSYSVQNVLRGSSYGARMLYYTNTQQNASRSALSLKSAYPAAYRNIVFAYRKNMYKDLYAKYGASRMRMRQGYFQNYSNMSLTKLRRQNYKYKVMYQTDRTAPIPQK